jgi:hypothetical protein
MPGMRDGYYQAFAGRLARGPHAGMKPGRSGLDIDAGVKA